MGGVRMVDQRKSVLVDDLANRIRELILNGEIPIGAPLRQAELAERFGTSRTPIREALRQLQVSGVVEVRPNKGAIVRVPAPWEIRELYEIRAELEALAARRAASRLTSTEIDKMRKDNDSLYDLTMTLSSRNTPPDEAVKEAANELGLHAIIHHASNNLKLQQMLRDMSSVFPRNVPALLLSENAKHREENHDEHVRILDALADGDADRAASLMRQHVLNAGEQVARWYELRCRTVLE